MTAAATAPFKTGKKQIFLPKFVVALCRPSKRLPPNYATFRVPLTFNKFDLRDYLLNAYNVTALKVTSHVLQSQVERDQILNRLKRPPPRKYMTIEMEEPFIWPAEPDEEQRAKYEERDPEARTKRANKKEKRTGWGENFTSMKEHDKEREGRLLWRQQAHDLLTGKTKWENKRMLDPKWTEKTKL